MKSQNFTDQNLSDKRAPHNPAGRDAAKGPIAGRRPQDAAASRHPCNTSESRGQRASRERRAKIIASWALVACVLVFIFVMSAQTGPQLNEGDGLFSQIRRALAQQAIQLTGHEVDVSPIGHFSEYLVLGIALANALRFHVKNEFGGWRVPLLATLLASLYGISDEFHQIFVPQRSCDPADWAVDTIAALIGALICCALLKRHSKRRR